MTVSSYQHICTHKALSHALPIKTWLFPLFSVANLYTCVLYFILLAFLITFLHYTFFLHHFFLFFETFPEKPTLTSSLPPTTMSYFNIPLLNRKKPLNYLSVITVATPSSLHLLLNHSIQTFLPNTPLKPQQPDSHSLPSYVPSTISEKLRTLPLSGSFTWLPGYFSLLDAPSISFTGCSSISCPLNVENILRISQGFPSILVILSFSSWICIWSFYKSAMSFHNNPQLC